MENASVLLSPIRLSESLTLKNRMIKSPQSTMYWDPDYFMNDRVIDFYESIAAGGAAMIILAGILWYPAHPGGIYGALYDDKYLPGMKRFVEVMHRHDCKVICQFHHTGPSSPTDDKGGRPFGSSTLEQDEMPSPLPYLHATRGVTLDEIAMHKERYIASAVRAKEAGFDGVEVHCAHGYFLESFLSRVWNRREDQYGPQSMENRTRIVREIIQGIREKAGTDFPIGVRINGEEFGAKNTMTLAESKEIAQILEKEGVCYISVSGYGFGPLPMTYVPDYFPYPEPEEYMKPYMDRYRGDGVYVYAAAEIKKSVKVPVIAVGRMDEVKAERLLEEGKADIIALGRTLWADPQFPNKVREGRISDIVRCTRCATCEDPPRDARRCRVNPAMGREREMAILPAEASKKVLIVGGGPAGMEAARVAAIRGHKVTLIEQAPQLGGRLRLASMIKGSEVEDVKPVYTYLIDQLERNANVNVRLSTKATADLIRIERPDEVILAVGGNYGFPDVPGIHRWNVQGVKTLSKLASLPLRVFGPDLLAKLTHVMLPIGRSITIMGGQIEAIQGAIFLLKRGKKVTLVEQTDKLGQGIPPRYLERALAWLDKKNVPIITEATYNRVSSQGLHITLKDGSTRTIKSHSIMVLGRQTPNLELASALGSSMPVRVIGSANGAESSLIVNALHEGRKAGISV